MNLEASGDITPTATLEAVDVGSATATDRLFVIQLSDSVDVDRFSISHRMVIIDDRRWLSECHAKELGSCGSSECPTHGAVKEEINGRIE